MVKRRNFSRRNDETLNIPEKSNRILNVVLVCMLLILLRVWHLAVVQHDEKLDESRKPQRRVQLEPAKRATIRDRFNIPLAINKLQYNVSILYSQIRNVPSIAWETDQQGVRKKRYKRREYITALSELLGNELDMDPGRIEDLIHAKAALYNQIPFVLKDNITEKEYYRLKMLENDWPGISVQRVSMRYYPKGKVAADIIGYMGAINNLEYEGIIREVKSLEGYISSVDMGEVLPLPDGMETTDHVRRRLKDLQELAYSVNDSIGKAGIEKRYESTLRGFRGKKSHYSDARGNVLSELPGSREPLSGKRVLLTISSELQEFAEQLLIENEKIRQPILCHLAEVKRNIPADKIPWIKGGAIVAMDPTNGEIIAMASHPRFDPNDFIAAGDVDENKVRRKNVLKWLESDSYLGEVWDGQRPLEREAVNKAKGIFIEELPLTWENYLNLILSKSSALHHSPLLTGTVADAVTVQKHVERLLELSPVKDLYQLLSFLYPDYGHEEHGKKLATVDMQALQEAWTNSDEIKRMKSALDSYFQPIRNIYDMVLLTDLYRTAVRNDMFSDALLQTVGRQSLSTYREASGAMVKINGIVKKMTREVFHDTYFKGWRAAHEKEYLKRIREEEKSSRKYARPYIDYLDAKENELFNDFWSQHRFELISFFLQGKRPISADIDSEYYQHLGSWRNEIDQGAHKHIEWMPAYFALKAIVEKYPAGIDIDYLRTLRSYQELDRPLYGKYSTIRKNSDGTQQEKHLAAAFYPKYGYGYGRSQAYRQSATQGSIFKLVTAYQALVQNYKTQAAKGSIPADLSPLQIVDQVWKKGKDLYVGYNADGTPIPRHYKGGRMPRSLNANIGQVDLIKAIEMSSNPYFALLAGDYLESPNDLAEAARNFSFGSKTGIDLPGEISGNIPNDLEYNHTGVYSFSIGQHTLVVTPLQTSVMLSSIVNGGKIFKPKLVELLVGKEPRRGKELISGEYYFPYQEGLGLVGIDFPLFVAADAEQQKSLVRRMPSVVQRELFYPPVIQRTLLDGMCRVVERTQKEGMGGLARLYQSAPFMIKDYVAMKRQFLGKTSTSESVENIDLDKDIGTNLYTHVWFGGISYEQDILNENEHRFLFRDSFGAPELVVVVYLRYGGYGKEAAPVAAQIAKRWKEIKARSKDNK